MRTRRADLDALIVWALATFHASFFLLAFLLFLYWQDVLRHILQGLNTALGLGLFVFLWAITYLATRRALSGLESDAALIPRAMRWGGVNGILFLLPLVVVQVGAGILFRPEFALNALIVGLAFGTIGSVVAFGVGALVGLIFANVDLALLAVARAAVSRAIAPEPPAGTASGE